MQPSLRDYQSRSISMLYDWFRQNSGHPCLVLPTGSGKSWINRGIVSGRAEILTNPAACASGELRPFRDAFGAKVIAE